MKLLIDMNLSAEWTEFLDTCGFEAVHWSRIGRAYEADETIMEHARQHGYIVLTEDLGFGLQLAQTGRNIQASYSFGHRRTCRSRSATG